VFPESHIAAVLDSVSPDHTHPSTTKSNTIEPVSFAARLRLFHSIAFVFIVGVGRNHDVLTILEKIRPVPNTSVRSTSDNGYAPLLVYSSSYCIGAQAAISSVGVRIVFSITKSFGKVCQ